MRRSLPGGVSLQARAPAGGTGDRHPQPLRARGRHELHLTALDQSLLYLLAANAGRVMTRDEILDHLWGVDFVASNVVDRHVRNLRAKLQNNWRGPAISPRCRVKVPLRADHRRGGVRPLRVRPSAEAWVLPILAQPGLKIASPQRNGDPAQTLGHPFSCTSRGSQGHEQLLKTPRLRLLPVSTI